MRGCGVKASGLQDRVRKWPITFATHGRTDHRDREPVMTLRVETLTPPNTPTPIGPYNHIARVGEHIWIGGTAGVDPATGQLVGADVAAQTRQILRSFKVMLEAVGSDLDHAVHINIFLKSMADFDAMNAVYAEMMGQH